MIEYHRCRWEEIPEVTNLIYNSKLKLSNDEYFPEIWPSGQNFTFHYKEKLDLINDKVTPYYKFQTTGFNHDLVFRDLDKYQKKIVVFVVTEYDTGMKFLLNIWFDDCVDDEFIDFVFSSLDINEYSSFEDAEYNKRLKPFLKKYKIIREDK